MGSCNFFLGMVRKREERWEDQGEDAWSVKYESIQNFVVHKEQTVAISSNASNHQTSLKT